MIKVCIIALFICAANAGIISTGLLDDGVFGHGIAVAAPVAVAHAPLAIAHAPIAVATHGATSYQNNNQISLNPIPVVAKVAVAAPVVTKVASVGVAPIGIGLGLGGVGLGGIGIGKIGIGGGLGGIVLH